MMDQQVVTQIFRNKSYAVEVALLKFLKEDKP
jgi:hypothetical protein